MTLINYRPADLGHPEGSASPWIARSLVSDSCPVRGAATSIEMITIGLQGSVESRQDWLVCEEPLEIRVADRPFAVIMRTPGHDEQLALGFFLSEGLITCADDLSCLMHCGRLGAPGSRDVLNAIPAAGSHFLWDRMDRGRRAAPIGSAGGPYGRLTGEDLLAEIMPIATGPTHPAGRITAAVDGLTQWQPLFGRTGGSHGAVAHAADGTALAWGEDVGRHNAVDKVVGAILMAQRAGDRRDAVLLATSSRIGFEIVQKAARARIPIVAGVSAPTSLAVRFAEGAGITLAGFVRSGRMNLYTHPHRITAE